MFTLGLFVETYFIDLFSIIYICIPIDINYQIRGKIIVSSCPHVYTKPNWELFCDQGFILHVFAFKTGAVDQVNKA